MKTAESVYLRTSAAITASALVLSACTVGADSAPPQPGHVNSDIHATPKSEMPKGSCNAPSATDISAARNMLQAPTRQDLRVDYNYGETNLFTAEDTNRQRLARQLGIHVVEDTKEIGQLQNDLFKKDYPTAHFMQPARSFLRSFGVSLTLGGAYDANYQLGAHAPSTAETESIKTKTELIDLMISLNGIPVEYVQDVMKLKRVTIMSGAIYYGGKQVSYERNDGVYLNTETMDADNPEGNIQTFAHEGYHDEDFHFCPGDTAAKDAGYTSYNTMPYNMIYDGEVDNRITPFFDVSTILHQIQDEQHQLGEHGTTGYCQETKKHDTVNAQIQTISPYHPNPMEDKAEIGNEIMQPDDYARFTDPHYPILRDKFTYLFARVYHKAPQVARYLAAISNHWSAPKDQPAC